jgi:hypothetical protein
MRLPSTLVKLDRFDLLILDDISYVKQAQRDNNKAKRLRQSSENTDNPPRESQETKRRAHCIKVGPRR